MANRNTHQLIGGAAGSALALYASRNEGPWDAIVEGFGGALGGVLGGMLPDTLEPAVSSYHRAIAHSYAAGAGVSLGAVNATAALQQRFRQAAATHEQLRAQSADPLSAAGHALAAFLLHLASGLVAGLPAGYVSHLALDATTPRGLPLLF